MQDDVSKVAQAIADAGGPYRFDLARAAMAATLELAAEALRVENGECDCFARSEGECGCGAWSDYKQWPLERTADWLQQRANDVRAIGAP
jgi:hypothetical protein